MSTGRKVLVILGSVGLLVACGSAAPAGPGVSPSFDRVGTVPTAPPTSGRGADAAVEPGDGAATGTSPTLAGPVTASSVPSVVSETVARGASTSTVDAPSNVRPVDPGATVAAPRPSPATSLAPPHAPGPFTTAGCDRNGQPPTGCPPP